MKFICHVLLFHQVAEQKIALVRLIVAKSELKEEV